MSRVVSFCPHPRFLAALFLGALLSVTPASAQSNKSIAKKDRVYANASMVDLGITGAYIKTADGFAIIPWAELSRFQIGTIHNSFQDALYNLRLKTYWVEAEVFQVIKDGGVVVNAGLVENEEEETEKEAPNHKRGAEVLSSLVYIKDYPGNPEEGALVEAYLYESGGTLTYEFGFGQKELKIYTLAKPAWAQASEWSDTKGRKMLAELIEVSDGNCRFLRNDKEFLFPLNQLMETDQERALKQQTFMRVIPLPEK